MLILVINMNCSIFQMDILVGKDSLSKYLVMEYQNKS